MSRIISFFLVAVMMLFNIDLSMGKIPFAKDVPQEHQKLIQFINKKTFVTYESANGTYVTKVSCTKEKFYNNYIEKLHQKGYTDYSVNSIDNNRFTTLTNDDTIVTVSYYEKAGRTDIISEPKGDLFVRENDNVYTHKGIKTLMTGMKLCEDVAREGMGFIIRLCDGRFVIIDGGMGDPDHIDSNKLMNILNEQNVNKNSKPVIAAWIFTHLHGDHVGVFNCFSIDHHHEVEIQNFYYNFPSEEDMANSESAYMLDKGDMRLYRYYQFMDCMNDYYADVPKIKVHTGNKFFVSNASFEVLFAPEDLLPDSICTTNLNSSSIIFKMTVDGQSTLWTGDTDKAAIKIAVKNFGSYLKSDILQMPHHGMNGTVEFFSKVNPTYSILAFHEDGYQRVADNKQNKWLVASEDMKQMIETAKGTWTVTLPYTPEDGFDRIPNENTFYPTYNGD